VYQSQIEAIKKQVALVKDPHLALTTPASELPLGIAPAYWLDLRDYHPEQVARRLPQPMLILQADGDYQVTPDDFHIWQNALSGRDDVKFKRYPGLYHLFISTQDGQKATPATYSVPGHVEHVVIDDIVEWIEQQ
jgi:fermentation-respiration switch protein FrsA (DUF1100 family)